MDGAREAVVEEDAVEREPLMGEQLEGFSSYDASNEGGHGGERGLGGQASAEERFVKAKVCPAQLLPLEQDRFAEGQIRG